MTKLHQKDQSKKLVFTDYAEGIEFEACPCCIRHTGIPTDPVEDYTIPQYVDVTYRWFWRSTEDPDAPGWRWTNPGGCGMCDDIFTQVQRLHYPTDEEAAALGLGTDRPCHRVLLTDFCGFPVMQMFITRCGDPPDGTGSPYWHTQFHMEWWHVPNYPDPGGRNTMMVYHGTGHPVLPPAAHYEWPYCDRPIDFQEWCGTLTNPLDCPPMNHIGIYQPNSFHDFPDFPCAEAGWPSGGFTVPGKIQLTWRFVD